MMRKERRYYLRNVCWILIAIFLVYLIPSDARGQDLISNRYEWKYNTIGHKLLKQEEDIIDVDGTMKEHFDNGYKTLDSLISIATERIKTPKNSRSNAVVVLKKIDKILFEAGYVMFGSVRYLNEGLVGKKLTDEKFSWFTDNMPPKYRKRHRRAKRKPSYFFADCDVSSLIYLSIGEVLELPLNAVLLPTHMFIRWQLESGESINWETQWAKTKSDGFYRKRHPITTSDDEFYNYMTNLDSDELYGYYSLLWSGYNLLNTKRHDKGIEYLEIASFKWSQSLGVKFFLAKAYIESDNEGKYVVAEDICTALLQKVGHNYAVWDLYGQIQKKLGDNTTAIEAFKKSISLNPKNSIAFKGLGEIYFENKDVENAAVNLVKAKELDKNIIFDKELNDFFVKYSQQ